MNTFLTIFTPTYNRSELLKRLYKSLCKQTNQKFEWIIIDDDSSDDTDNTVNSFISEAKLKIRYEKQPHGGKHRAVNKAVKMSSGNFFFIVDSDDYLPENAVELIYEWLSDIDGKPQFAGVSGLKCYSNGDIVGGLPANCGDFVDTDNLKRYKYGLTGDKAEVYNIELLKKHPFPEIEGEYFLTERYCWDAVAAEGYKLRWYFKAIYICEYLPDGLTRSGANKVNGHITNYKGYCMYVKQALKLQDSIEAITVFRDFNKTSSKMKKNFVQRSKELNMSLFTYILWYLIKMPFWYAVRLLGNIKT
ncbi:MAG: glycosyltransferase family 2 protein [Eubacterium sp.]|nr:glycosyltransferase family 2 protein [Eubacterium sp.]